MFQIICNFESIQIAFGHPLFLFPSTFATVIDFFRELGFNIIYSYNISKILRFVP